MTSIPMPSGTSTYIRECGDMSGMRWLIDGREYYKINYCGEYAIYYLNSHGGWDAFLFEGNCIAKHNYEYKEYGRFAEYNEPAPVICFNRQGTVRYETQVENAWQLNTGWLTDAQSKRFADNVYGSNQIYLHNLAENTIVPVYISDSSVEEKKFANGKKLINYALNVKMDKYAR